MLTEYQEVNDINKQTFLAELGRLLTFMQEEDRKMALAMYSDMFDSCRDEELLVQSLGSPTRQAVAIARNYDAKERKLQLTSEDRGTVPGETPAFMVTIGNIMDEALEGNRFIKPVDENQFSLFRDDDQPHVDFVQETPAVEEPAAAATFSVPEVIAPVISAAAAAFDVEATEPAVQEPDAPVVEGPEGFPAETPEYLPAEALEDLPAEAPEYLPAEEPAAYVSAPHSDISIDDFLAGILGEEPSEETNVAEEFPEEIVPAETEDIPPEPDDPVDRFIAVFSFGNEQDEDVPQAPVRQEPVQELPAEADPSETPEPDDVYPSLYDEDEFYTESEPKLKASPILLILYIIAAIPLSLIGIVVLLVLTVVILALAAGCVVGGLFVFSAGLGGLTMIADIMVVLGGGIALFALGLLFLWTAVWLVCGAVFGLIRGVFTLAKKWCYKEVEQ